MFQNIHVKVNLKYEHVDHDRDQLSAKIVDPSMINFLWNDWFCVYLWTKSRKRLGLIFCNDGTRDISASSFPNEIKLIIEFEDLYGVTLNILLFCLSGELLFFYVLIL